MTKNQILLLEKLERIINELSFECEKNDWFNIEMFELGIFKHSLDELGCSLAFKIEDYKERYVK